MPIISISPRSIKGALPISLRDFINEEQWGGISARLGYLQGQSHSLACCVECGVWVCLCCLFPCIFCCHNCIARCMIAGRWTAELDRMNNEYFRGAPVLTGGPANLLVNTDLVPRTGDRLGSYTAADNSAGVMMMPTGSANYSSGGYQQVPQQAVINTAPTNYMPDPYRNTTSDAQASAVSATYDPYRDPASNKFVSALAASSHSTSDPYHSSSTSTHVSSYPTAGTNTSNSSNQTAYPSIYSTSDAAASAPPYNPSSAPISSPYSILSSPKKRTVVVIPPNVVAGSVLTLATPDGQTVKMTVEPHHLPGQQVEIEY